MKHKKKIILHISLCLSLLAIILLVIACGSAPSPNPVPTPVPTATNTPTPVPGLEKFLPPCPVKGVVDNTAVSVQWGEIIFDDPSFPNEPIVDIGASATVNQRIKVDVDHSKRLRLFQLKMETIDPRNYLECLIVYMSWQGQPPMPIAYKDYTKDINAPFTKAIFSPQPISLDDPFLKAQSNQIPLPIPPKVEVSVTYDILTTDGKLTRTTFADAFTFSRAANS